MTNQDVKEIVRLEGRATLAERASSGDRWHAAHLISAQLARKTYRQLSQEIVSAGGKGSIGHLERMAKCWKLVGRVQYETHKEDWARYPNFTTVYQSDEVRGTAEESSGSQGSGGRDEEDQSAHGLTMAAANAIAKLARNRVYWPLLTEDDVNTLKNARDELDVLISRVRR